MADFALGLTKMAMEGTVSRVKLAIEEEKKLRVKVQNDLVFITGEFEMMQSFLKVANVKGAHNEVVRTWVRQIRDLAFDVEDCVEFVVHLDKKTSLGWLWRFGLMVVSCDAPPLPLDKAVNDIKDIKARVEDVCQRNVRYNLIVDSGSNSTKPMSLAEQPDRANTCPSAFHILREVWEDMGKCRSNSMADLEKLIKSQDSDLQVISVWGSAGTADLGVASILMKAYNDPEICERFNTRAWVKLMTPFQPDEFIKSMLIQVCVRSSEDNVGAEFLARMKSAVDMEDAHLKAKLMRQLMSGLRYLVILEEVSTVVEWDVIKSYLPDSNNGSRLIVSTNQLQIALLCTGKPYQVSELTRFSDDQSLCAFSKKSGRGSGTRELIWQIRCRGVTSVWGSTGDIKSTIVHKVYTSIMYKSKQFEGVEFERHSWVDVPVPFNLEVFSRRLLLNFRSQDLQVDEIAAVGMMRDPGLTEECCKFLRENDCLVVINGLQSTNEWDMIKATFLSKPIKGCILAITNEERVAAHCIDNENGVLSIKDLETDPVLRALIKGCEYYGVDDRQASRTGRFFSARREEARDWLKKHRSHPFNLINFSRRLLLDFHSDDLQYKRSAAVGIMEGQDPIQGCCEFLRKYKCLIVVDGLGSRDDWDSIRDAFLSEPTKGCIIVITNNENVAKFGDLEEHQLERNGNVISVWGIAGVGKSTLVRSVFCHAMLGLQQKVQVPGTVCTHIHARHGFTMYSWVDVPHPFNLTDFSRCLLLDFYSDDLQAKKAAAVGIVQGQDPIQACRRIMHQHKCLVVMDGLRSTDDWDLIKAAFLPDSAESRIIVITNEKKVAMHCVGKEAQLVNVKGLNSDSALNLFNKMTQGCRELTLEHIVAKCGGIIKVIDVIGKLLAKEIIPSGGQSQDMSRETKKLLNDINGDFMGTLEKDPKFHCLRGLFAWMQSYFDTLSDSLKPCIFYMSVFPAKRNIRRRRLLRRWIAEGYSRDTSDRVAEENGERLFLELVSLSIVQHREANNSALHPYEEKGSSVLCQVNAFFHEYIISRQMEDNLVFALDGHCSLNSQHAGQHLTIRSSWDRDEIVFRGIDVSRLRSLTVFGVWKPFLISEKMRLVRVLDLEEATDVTNDHLEHIRKLLPRLKFLSLRGHKKISLLPESLCGLRQLQTLDVRGTSVIKLPLGISKLQKLQYIRAGTILTKDEGDDTVATSQTEHVDQISTPAEDTARVQEAVSDGVRASTTSSWSRPQTLVSSWFSKFQKPRQDNGSVKVPAGIGNLTALHTIGVVNVAAGKAVIKELKNLTQLRKLGVSGINREHWTDFCSAISGYAHLESLSVRVDQDKGGLFARFGGISKPPKTLKSLKAYGHVQISPVWLLQLQNIKKVKFSLSILTQRDVEELGLYRSLRIENGYWNMTRVLEIECTSRLELSFGELHGKVEVLKIQCSSGSSLQISLLENLIGLKEVWLSGFYHDDLKQDLERQLSSHPRKPVLKTEEPRSS
ncbi:disease resistance protein Pik-2-like [Lolium rigidum]|uniref:disease resistance protein Pik-2-like n=1 Tax=Lolium rigidum TaxID=89674 RepID=UPI001F5D0146|nr:disease resistance protein Pik-2-like [Lolium rigidum]